MLVVHQCEEPSPQIGAGRPELLLRQRASQRVLDEIVSPVSVMHEGAGVTPQTRDLGFKARDCLASVCGRFTEGFETADLIAANRLLHELNNAS